LDIRLQEQPQHVVVAVAGEVDMATAPELRTCLDALEGRVVVDLAEVTFLDSSGMGALVVARKRLLDLGGDLVVRAPQPHVRHVLEVTGLTELLEDAEN
jgi:anti-anti-sigma factor